MTALADTLRERISRRGRTARVDCGALGVLTVESLSVRDCSALAERCGSRGLFYAACRELQEAGEILRREGHVFAPDEIMEYVSDQEAETAAEAVLLVSGAENPAEENTDHTAAASSAQQPAGKAPSGLGGGAGSPEAACSSTPGEPSVPAGEAQKIPPPGKSAGHRRTPPQNRPFPERPSPPAAARPDSGAPREPASGPNRHMRAAEPAAKIPGGEFPAEPGAQAAPGRVAQACRGEPGGTPPKAAGIPAKAREDGGGQPRADGRTPERPGGPVWDTPAFPEAEPPGERNGVPPEPPGSPEAPENTAESGDFNIPGSAPPLTEALFSEPLRRDVPKDSRDDTAVLPAPGMPPAGGSPPVIVSPDMPSASGGTPETLPPDSPAARACPEAELACEISPEAAEQMAWHLLEGLRQAAAVR